MSECTCTGSGLTQEDGLTAWLTHCHRRCDALWAQVEEAAADPSTAKFGLAVTHFAQTVRNHLVTFRQFFADWESEVPMAAHGPLPVMLAEHQQMRGLLEAITEAAAEGHKERVLNLGDTLLMLTQQHNSKEEAVLYPLCERALGSTWASLHAEIAG